ncbi:MAG TPA: methylated-DNA--[protein]-cysteine S-methyltransferase [Pseudonocardia sp.]|jgi:methylated-DNA-[protein]-cysteine S-methyltransferase
MHTHDTPLGTLSLAASAAGLTRCSFRPALARPERPTDPAEAAIVDQARRELDDYLAGRLREFTVPVDLSNVDPERRRILAGLTEVGYGGTTSYGALATALGMVGYEGARAVGAAMAANPVLIVVPCHRVLGASGKLTGYAGGLEVKRRLLELELHDRAEPSLW